MGIASWNRRFHRVRSMDRLELSDRLRQYVTARTDIFKYGRRGSVAAIVGAGPVGPLGRFFFTSSELRSISAVLKQVFPSQASDIVARADSLCQHRFDLLGYANLDCGAEIAWHCDVVHGKRAPRKPWFKIKYLDFNEVGDSKITWELNRHQHFVTLAKAYWLTGNDKFALEVFAQWADWQKNNPYPIGINWASSLEVGYRSLSWIWTFFLLQECPLFSPQLRDQWQSALALSGRHVETYLSTHFSPNTHLLGEALALFAIGTLFPSLQDATRWRQRGWEILEIEAAKQVRQDGFYFEQSTYYHVYAADIFLHARILAGLNQVPIRSRFDEILQRMLDSLMLLGRPGVATTFGDDDGGRLFDPCRNRAEHMLDPLATGAVLYRRGDFKALADAPREETLWLLGAKGLSEFDALPRAPLSIASTALPDSGFYLMAGENNRQQLLIDAGPLGAGSGGHGHADALSISLVRNGRVLLSDPGTFEYVGGSGERDRLRGTSAHNTMRINGADQAEATGPFSWGRTPQVKVEHWITGTYFDFFQGSHDGYSRLPFPVLHRRSVFQRKGQFWMVRDVAEGSGSHHLDIAWHLGPTLSHLSANELLFSDQRGSLALLTAEPHGWSQNVSRNYCSPAYGKRELATVVNFNTVAELPVDFVTLLIADDVTDSKHPTDRRHLRRVGERSGVPVSAYRYSTSQQEHSFFFAPQTGPWDLGAWASDANFLCCSFDREKGQCMLVLCNGSYARVGGRPILTASQLLSYAEVISSATTNDLASSDPDKVVLQESLFRLWSDGDVDVIVPSSDTDRIRV
jgi:hypothetical protein